MKQNCKAKLIFSESGTMHRKTNTKHSKPKLTTKPKN